jgi:hypothetical protein
MVQWPAKLLVSSSMNTLGAELCFTKKEMNRYQMPGKHPCLQQNSYYANTCSISMDTDAPSEVLEESAEKIIFEGPL